MCARADGAERAPEIDGLRALAILLVLVFHYLHNQIVVTPATPAAYALASLRTSWAGVDLFFVLSGYLIGGILLDHGDRPRFLRAFMIRRACRILPVYALVLLAFAGFARAWAARAPWLLEAGDIPLAAYATFTQNFVMGAKNNLGATWMAATWSLAIEEQFYLFAPIVIPFASARMRIALVVILLLAAPLARAAFGGLDAYVNTLCRLDCLAAGLAVALLVRTQCWRADPQRARAISGTALAALAITAVVWSGLWPKQGGVGVHTVFAGASAAVLAAILARAGSPGLAQGLRWGALGWLGRRSYAVYLFHLPVAGGVHAALFGAPPRIVDCATALATLASLAATLALAELSWRALESRAIGWGRRFAYDGRGDREPAGKTAADRRERTSGEQKRRVAGCS